MSKPCENLNDFVLEQDSEVPFNSPNSLVTYLVENKIYDSYASGDYDNFGVLIKTFADIQPGCLVRITSIDKNKFQIDYVDEKLPPEVIGLFIDTDCNMNLLKKLGYKINSKKVKMALLTLTIPPQDNQNSINKLVSYNDFLTNWIEETNNKRILKGMKPVTKEQMVRHWNLVYK